MLVYHYVKHTNNKSHKSWILNLWLYFLQQQVAKHLWKTGSQALMLLVFYQNWSILEPHWNVDGLGYKRDMQTKTLGEAAVLHWSGHGMC